MPRRYQPSGTRWAALGAKLRGGAGAGLPSAVPVALPCPAPAAFLAAGAIGRRRCCGTTGARPTLGFAGGFVGAATVKMGRFATSGRAVEGISGCERTSAANVRGGLPVDGVAADAACDATATNISAQLSDVQHRSVAMIFAKWVCRRSIAGGRSWSVEPCVSLCLIGRSSSLHSATLMEKFYMFAHRTSRGAQRRPRKFRLRVAAPESLDFVSMNNRNFRTLAGSSAD